MSTIERAARQALEALERGETKLRFDAITSLRAALEQPAAPAAPGGWKLVPVEPTQEMLWALYGRFVGQITDESALYADMLEAAPESAAMPPVSKDLIRTTFLAHGFTVKEGQTDLKPYVYEAAYALLNAAAPAAVAQQTPPQQDTAAYNGWMVREVLFNDGEPVGHRAVEQEPVEFLAGGARFKTSVFPYGVCINGLPKDLAGRWVALVAAENYRHLTLTNRQPRQPLTEQQKLLCWSRAIDADVKHKTRHQCLMDYGSEIEAAHGITSQK